MLLFIEEFLLNLNPEHTLSISHFSSLILKNATQHRQTVLNRPPNDNLYNLILSEIERETPPYSYS